MGFSQAFGDLSIRCAFLLTKRGDRPKPVPRASSS